jgi:hypothetical protein
MRHWGALGVGLLTWLLAGCVTGPAGRTTAWLRRSPPVQAPKGPDFIQMEIAVLECPLGDRFINEELWTDSFADEQIVSPEHKEALQANGFRVAQLGGLIPDQLQELLTSSRSNVNPRRRRVMAGYPAALNLGSRAASVHYAITQDGEPVAVDLDQAQCKLIAVPSITPEGRVKLRFTPEVEYGETEMTFQPAPERQEKWQMSLERPRKSYPSLAWEVTLQPNQYMVVGTRIDQPRSLGFASFIQRDEVSGVQRLLVIRTARETAGGAPRPEGMEEVCSRKSPPLAFQAQGSSMAVRASGP